MPKSRIGPFALEAPLSKQTESGQVFRAIHLEQRKLAALRVFSIPMGMTPESRKAFASQLEQLKQLRHQGIARCYGGGLDTRNAFLAYELVDGESLHSLLQRRGRLPWETALEYCQQMAEALQYGHQMGWVHGRLRPGKVMLTKTGTTKITDWRRGEITSMISDAGRRRVSLQYSAPETLDGTIDEKSDLYSLGAVLFKMLTGDPPFDGENADDLTTAVRTQKPESVSSVVLECPVWLNAIVEQLLAKDPLSRPYSVQALQLAFKEAQRRQVEGVGVLQHAAAGFSPLKMNVDRDEAEKVLGIKPKKKKRKQSSDSFWERPWVLGLGLVAAVVVIVWFMLPLNERALRQRSEALLQSEEWTDWNEARRTYLQDILDRFPDGSHAEWALEQIQWVEAREAERRLDRDERTGRKDSWTQAQIQYSEARDFERFGDLTTALDKFRAIVRLFKQRPEDQAIVYLASEGIVRIREKGASASELHQLLEQKLADAEAAYDRARITDAKGIWESIIELYSANKEVAPLVDQASRRLDSVNSR